MTDPTTHDPTPLPSTFGRRRVLLLAVALVAGLLVVPVAMASAARGVAAHHWGGHAGWHARTGELTEDTVRDHLDFAADHVLRRVDATDAQRAEVDAVLDELAPALLAQRQAGQGLHDELRAALVAETVDPVELERLRVELVEHVDEATAALTGGLVDLADVLTAEQRAALADSCERPGHR